MAVANAASRLEVAESSAVPPRLLFSVKGEEKAAAL